LPENLPEGYDTRRGDGRAMKSLGVLFLLLCATSSTAQTIAPGVSEKDSSFIAGVVSRLQHNKYRMPPFRWIVVHTSVVNSKSKPQESIVYVFDSMPQFLDYSPDEMAFVIAHEIGHIQDKDCEPRADYDAEQSPISPKWTRKMEQHRCEEHADEIGMVYMIGAGYDPRGASAALGRLQMQQGDTGMKGLQDEFTKNHPIDSIRIAKLRRLLNKLCPRQSYPCQ
jgi:predicted Zn-dependent protease